MSYPFGQSVLTLDEITKAMRACFEGFTDPRRGKNKRYTMTDAALSAFSVFFMQSPSFLEHQRRMEQSQGRNNAQSLFGVYQIPSDNQIRNLLDATDPKVIRPLFGYLFEGLERSGVLESYRSVEDTLLVALDGTEYFSSQAIGCEHCLKRRNRNGTVTCYHTALTAALVKPGCDKVIPLAPGFVRTEDGADKQDCELNAAKRWLADYGPELKRLGVTVLGDDLYCHEPFCSALQSHGLHFILTCKPTSHPTTYEWVADLERIGAVATVMRTRWTGRRREIDTYRYVNQVPLRDADDALMINWCELVTCDTDGNCLYRNAFATSFTLNDEMVVKLVEAGRCRWKIENENNNTLKTKGYHFTHNYGHGRQYLSSVLASLIILAFLVHTVLAWMDDNYRLLCQKIASRKRLFNDIRALTCYLYFPNWEALMTFMVDSFDSPSPILDTG